MKKKHINEKDITLIECFYDFESEKTVDLPWEQYILKQAQGIL